MLKLIALLAAQMPEAQVEEETVALIKMNSPETDSKAASRMHSTPYKLIAISPINL